MQLARAMAKTQPVLPIQAPSTSTNGRPSFAASWAVSPKTLNDLLAERVHAKASEILYTFVDGGREETLTFGDLQDRAQRIAQNLVHRGLQGERVLLIYACDLEYVIGLFGCLLAGAIAVNVHPPYKQKHFARLMSIVRDCGAKVALSTASQIEMNRALPSSMKEGFDLELVATDTLWKNSERAELWRLPKMTSDDIAILQYTSGSTGDPKGVVLSHGNLMANSIQIADAYQLGEDDVCVSWLPFYHDMGLIGGVLQPLYLGSHGVLMPPQTIARPVRWLEAITKYRATSSPAPNFAFDMATTRITEAQKANIDLSTMRLWSCGAEPVRFETMRAFCAAFEKQGARLSQFSPSYGLAEGTLAVTMDGPNDRKVVRSFRKEGMRAGGVASPVGSDDPSGAIFVGCGRPLMGQDVRIVQPESGRPLPAFHVGEICVAGRNVAQGYWRRPDLTKKIFGFEIEGRAHLRTGDLGFLDDRGILYVVGRIKEMIIVRGRNFYPHDLEDACRASDARLSRSVAAAFAVDTSAGEGLVIVIEAPVGLNEDALKEISAACRGRISDEFDLNTHEIRFTAPGGVPRTSSGKIRRGQAKILFSKNALMPYDSGPLGELRARVKSHSTMIAFKTQLSARIALSRMRSILPLSSLGRTSTGR